MPFGLGLHFTRLKYKSPCRASFRGPKGGSAFWIYPGVWVRAEGRRALNDKGLMRVHRGPRRPCRASLEGQIKKMNK